MVYQSSTTKEIRLKKQKMPGRFNLLTLIQRFGKDFSLLYAMIKDIASGRYRKIPVWSIAVLGFAVLYILHSFFYGRHRYVTKRSWIFLIFLIKAILKSHTLIIHGICKMVKSK